MFVELLMKKNGKLLFGFFIVVVIATIIFGGIFVSNSLNTSTSTFKKDGYALSFDGEKNNKATAYTFKNGTEYKYKLTTNTINFKYNNQNVNIDENTIIHYADKSVGVLKKVVGLDLSTIDREIIFYYNIYKNTQINWSAEGYNIKLANAEKVKFKNLLIRVNNDKFMLTGNNVRLVLNSDEIIDFGEYVEFEYYSGNVVKVYNDQLYYQTISSDAYILVDDIKINLKEATIFKGSKKYISLTNLVIDNDGNIDTLEEELEKIELEEGNIELPDLGTPGAGNGGGVIGGGDLDEDLGGDTESGTGGSTEEVEDPTIAKKLPEFRVTEMQLSALKIEAKIEIVDQDGLITTDSEVKIIENQTNKAVFEETAIMGDTQVLISYADLKPDTEYTITAKSTYKMEDEEYERIFVSKIFRTEDIGVTFEKTFATERSLTFELTKEKYSKVSSLKMELLDAAGNQVNYAIVSFSSGYTQYVEFSGLTSDTAYTVKMSEILSEGVIVKEGYSQIDVVKTLKAKPQIGNLTYEIDKKLAAFHLNVSSVQDTNYGIQNYRYEVYDARTDIATSEPIVVLSREKLSGVTVNVDDVKLQRGVTYTYLLVLEFFDNEKVVEYSKELGDTMTLEGVQFPSVRFDEETSYVTWEQINGTIIIEDPASAIVSNEYQIVYKNSIDVYVSEKITANTETGNIPININGLRANETYTFQVYATINLQDGNDTESGVYIGSVIVQTKEPNPLVAHFDTTDDYSNAFSLQFQLKDDVDSSAELEASTLTEMTFTIYKGASIEGEKEIYKKTVDIKEEAYESSLKEEFYDVMAVITPEFFNARNTDFYEETYTIEVSNAVDYTSYKNVIPIKNNTFSFKLNSYLPELPEDFNDAATVNTITNNIAPAFGMDRREDLAGSTTVAYGLIPKFNNETKRAKYIVWHPYVYNQETKEYEALPHLDKTTNFNDDGSLDATIFELGDGTTYDVVDKDILRRGNTYRFSYEIFMDINGDGTIDTEYPKAVDEEAVLRSRDLSPLKQSAEIEMYPSISTSNSYTWNYRIQDIDNALETNNLYSYVDGSTKETSKPEIITNTEDYQQVTFTGLTAEKVILFKKQERRRKIANPVYETLNTFYFYGAKSGLDISYDVALDINKIVISINDYYDKIEEISSIAAVDIIVSPTDPDVAAIKGTKKFSGIALKRETIEIDFFQIAEFLSTDIKVEMIAYYDSGKSGFDLTSEYVALQKVSTNPVNNYYAYEGTLYQNSVITNSIYKYELKKDLEPAEKDEPTNALILTTPAGAKINLPVDINYTGVLYEENNIVLKELATKSLSSSNNQVNFDMIIPGISIRNSVGRIDISSLLDSAEINAKLTTIDQITLQDNMIYIDLYETDENGTNAVYITTHHRSVSQFSSPITIEELEPETNYYIQLYTYVYNNKTQRYEKKFLYDMDEGVAGYKYNFYTLAKVDVTRVTHELNEYSYKNKKLSISYKLDTIYGFDRIEYRLQKKVGDNYVNTKIRIPNATTFFSDMTLTIDATPGVNKEIVYGGDYRIYIKPIGHYDTEDGRVEIDLGEVYYDFHIEASQQPIVGITSGKTASSIYFKVSISDPDFIIEDGLYDIKLVDEYYNVIAEINDQPIDTINKRFTFTNANYNLQTDRTYTFVVSVNLNETNDGVTFNQLQSKKAIIYGDTLNLGIVTTAKNVNNPFAVDIIFAESYKLTTVTSVQYTITNASTDFYLSKKEDFVVRYDAVKMLYYYTINLEGVAGLVDNDMYTIGMNFYDGTKLIGQTEVTYYYIA
jgi:hypothetical protein